MGGDHPVGVGRREGRRSGQHLVDHARQRVLVAAAVQSLTAGLLGRGVVDGSDEGSGPGQRAVGGLQLGDPEIAQVGVVRLLGAPARVDEDVLGLDVTVHEPVLVGHVERPRHLVGDVQRPGQRERALALGQGGQVVLDQAHGEVVPAVVLAVVVDGEDVRMRDARRVLGLVEEPEAELGGAGEARVEQLDGHPEALLEVEGAVDGAHATAPDELVDPEPVAQRRAPLHPLGHRRKEASLWPQMLRRELRRAVPAGPVQRVGAGEARPAPVGREERAHLVLLDARARHPAAAQMADELSVGDVTRGEHVVAALPEEGEDVDGPRADARDSPQPRPAALLVSGAEVDAAPSHLEGRAPQRERAAGAQVARLELGRSDLREAHGGGDVPQPRPRAARAPAPNDPAFDLHGAPIVDELLADRPGQRLERLRTAGDAQVRRAAHRRPDQRVEAKPLVEGAQVIVDPEREAHPRDRLGADVPAPGRPRAHHDPVGPGLRRPHDRPLTLHVDEPLEHRSAAARDAVHPAAGQAEGPGGTDLDTDVLHRQERGSLRVGAAAAGDQSLPPSR
ncbi:MAG: hypothetical protein AVDCRST_MAG53-2602 [uncultured Solirubrobacteraceae bacterium]|uniref:Uncharacterized protein n=1 Tax=uncultured Solirubrobacteraceae bacterium TaxID=1162706 RepID=A0A6J4T123_9ACTN|nr:MAG: hypothetical protein AVDCRST_MAG53-2602 [uncultured Solirubrobacteraceae bacterium]